MGRKPALPLYQLSSSLWQLFTVFSYKDKDIISSLFFQSTQVNNAGL